jgi:gamma-glutamyltranspeptidase/glutathione hydrolase
MPFVRAALVLALLAPAAAAQDRPAQPEATIATAPAREGATAAEFMVAAAHPLAAEAGYDVLAAGGSAADAAVAIQAMLGLVEPQSSGLGGGGFLLYWDAESRSLASFDGRETAPAEAGPDYWLGPDGEPVGFWDAVVGGRSVGAPGTVRLLETVHQRYGRRPWAGLFAPAIATAERGFPVSRRLAASIAEAEARGLATFAATRDRFFDAAGAPLAEGATLSNPDYAATLRRIAAEGAPAFYQGEIAAAIAAATRTEINPGLLSAADLAAYEVRERPPVCASYRAFEVCGMGPPSSGGLAVGQMLGMLEGFGLATPQANLNPDQLLIEAARLAFADRGRFVADPDFADVPAKGMLDPAYLAERAALIDPGAAAPEVAPGRPPWDEGRSRASDRDRPEFGTTHFVVVDAAGDVLSATSSIETGFGSRVTTHGFLLNNQLTDFAFAPEEGGAPVANRVEGGKRPRSSMAPTIVFRDGEPVLALGSPGGARIIPYVAAALIGVLDLGLDPQAAIDRPHVANGGTGLSVAVEAGPEAEARIEALGAFGYEAEAADLNSGLHAILIGDGRLVGAADGRREGVALGR